MRATPSVLVLPLLLAAVLLASCSGGSGGAGGEPPAQPPPATPAPERIPTDAPGETLDRPTPAPDPLTSAPPAGATTVAADRVDATVLPAGFPTLVWARDATTLGVYGRAGGCTEARASVVEQGPEQVVVRVEQVTTSPGPCTRELLYPPLEVRLEAPLADRRVVLRGEVR